VNKAQLQAIAIAPTNPINAETMEVLVLKGHGFSPEGRFLKPQKHPSAAKAGTTSALNTARLKPCPSKTGTF